MYVYFIERCPKTFSIFLCLLRLQSCYSFFCLQIYKLNLGELNRDSEQRNKTKGKSRADPDTSKKNLPLSTEMNRNVTHGAKQIIGELNRQPTKNPPRKAFTWQEIVDRSRRKGETKVCDKDNLNMFPLQCFPTAAAQVHRGGHSARSCSECPSSHGAAWCNGECEWFQGVCVET